MDQYDRLGDNYIRDNESSLINEYYERPTIRRLLGDVRDLRVLDVGCGPGVMAAWLVEQGADVVAGDKSRAMVAAAKSRLGSRPDVLYLDLNHTLPFRSEEFDVVLASLVLHYIEDWSSALRELQRVLKPAGRLVLSTHHPFADYRWFERPNYFATELVRDVWNKGGADYPMEFWRRPLSAMWRDMRGAGFSVDHVVEPQPLREAADLDPEWYREMTTEPAFLFFALRRGETHAARG